MKSATWARWLLAATVVAVGLCAVVRPCEASEKARKFLTGLRELGYFDTALEYLEMCRNDPTVDKTFKDAIDYEAGVCLIDDSRMGRVTAVREKQLGEARDRFKKFLGQFPHHPQAASANTQLANLLVERGRIKSEQLDKPNKTADEKNALRQQARELYQEAQKVFEDLEQRFLAEHKKFPKLIDPKETAKIEARDEVRRNLLQARLALATVVYEIAKTYPADGADFKTNMEGAAKKYNEMYEKYGAKLAGLYARMWEGRCYKEMGDDEKAFEALRDLAEQPDEPPAFRTLKNKAMILAMETALLPKVHKYKDAVDSYEAWEKTMRGDEDTNEEGLAMQYLGGEAHFLHAQSLTKKDQAKARAESIKAARALYKAVSKREGEYQKKAKTALMRPEFAGEDAELPEPVDFVEARDRAKDELDRMQNPNLKPDEVAKARTEAIKYYRMAISMRTPETTPAEMNVIRYYLSYLYWMAQDLHEAAVMGEFLARRYSDGIGARQGAKIAMASYVTLYNEVPPGESTDFENNRMVSIASYITQRWKGEPEAAEAWMMLIRNSVVEGKPKQALEYLKSIPADSPRRGDAELMTGQSMWSAYLKASKLPEGEKPPQAELDEMVSQAQQTLEAGISRMRKPVDDGGEISYTLIASVLSVAQIYIGAGQGEKAVVWLDDPKIGAVTLVGAKHPETDRGNFRVETYKAALRAYVSAQKLDDAEKAMNSLEELIGPEGGAKLTRIYISLGRQLEELLTRLREEGKNQEADAVARGFELFLTRISERQQGNTFSSLNWVAETFMSLGGAMDPGGKALSSQAENYYNKAADTYRKIIELCETQEGFASQAGAATSIKIRLARCLRRLGNYKEAMDLLVGILKVRNMMVDAQVEAALTYQAWGAKDPRAYSFAIKGGRQEKQEDGSVTLTVWGWGKLAKRVMHSPKHEAVFFESRFNLADCRYRQAKGGKDAAARAALAKQAESDVLIIQRLYPKMGGQETYDKFNELLKKIQTLRGVPVTGLKAPEKKTPAEKTAVEKTAK